MLKLLNLFSKAELEAEVHSAEKKGRREVCEDLVEFHEKHAFEQERLLESFSYSKIEKICINIWDELEDISTGGFKTYCYVEDRDIPDAECYMILLAVMDFIKRRSLIPASVVMRVEYYDSTTKYPQLVSEHLYSLYKRWQIQFHGITNEQLDILLEGLQSIPKFQWTELLIYS